MNKTWANGLVAGVVIATAGGAIAGYNMVTQDDVPFDETTLVEEQILPEVPVPEFAQVLNVSTATQSVTTPRQVCEEVEVTHQSAPRDQHQVAGTATGAVIGGFLGSKIGGGNGKKLATVAGAALGGYAGNKAQERVQANDTYTTTETRCDTVSDVSQQIIGYDVTYRIGDQEGQTRMDRDPGDTIPLVNGELAFN